MIRNDMRQYLLSCGIKEQNILCCDIDIQEIYPPYFDKDIIEFKNNECYVQAGCYDGKTVFDFIDNCSSWKQILTFEPDPINLKNSQEIFLKKGLKNIDIIPEGLAAKKDEVRFNSTGSSARANENGDIVVKVDSLDNILKSEKFFDLEPTYITLDIEGAEMDALKGMKETVIKYKPRLAISIYHRPEDIFLIPEYIYKLNSRYKFYLRHYTLGECDTVLFAI